MKPIRVISSKYEKDAYTDQTGKSHWGQVVYDEATIYEVARFDQDMGYGIEKDAGIEAMDAEGRIYRGTIAIDYHASYVWKREDGMLFTRMPYSFKGYVNSEGEPYEPYMHEH